MRCAPVVILPFARPDNLGRVLDQVRAAAPSMVFVGSDGPRPDFPKDVPAVGQVRDLLDRAIDWDCEVRRFDRVLNVGVQANAELTLDAVFAEVPSAIVLDDDCVPDPSFFDYCSELLNHYAGDDRIMHIAGCNENTDQDLFDGFSYAFTAFGSNWGWATWARAWSVHRAGFPRPHDATTKQVAHGRPPYRYMPLAEPRTFRMARDGDLVTPAGRRFFGDVAAGDDLSLSEWGQQWRLSMLNHGGLAVTPAVNLIENVGFAPGSDSGMPTRDMQRAATMIFPLLHPDRVEINPEVERVLERNLVRAVGRLARRVRARTPQSLREPIRRIGAMLVR